MPDEPEVLGLLAMMLPLDVRREARFQGEDLVLLADQDPSLWDAKQIAAAAATSSKPQSPPSTPIDHVTGSR
jgi:RNA polymerase sigma-70 factor, ECF subfamily